MKNNCKLFLRSTLLSSIALLLGACGEAVPSISVPPELDANITLTKITEDFETHTDLQKQYFTNNDYKTLPSGVSGNKENSKPNAIHLSWQIDANEEITGASLLLSENENMFDPIQYDILGEDGVKTSLDVTNLKVSTQYYWRISLNNGEKLKFSDVETFTTLGNGPRFIDIDGITNVRDIGGWATEDGKQVKQGLIYRGSEWNKQNYSNYNKNEDVERAKDAPYGKKLTSKGEDTIRNVLKIKTELDVRGYEHYEYIDSTSQYYLNPSPTEIGGLTDGKGVLLDIQYILNPIDTNHDKIYKTDGGKAAVKRFFTTLADVSNYPVYFHCAQGKDRTGFIGYLLDGFLGLSQEDACRDFNTSNYGSAGSVKISYYLNSSDPSKDGDRYDYGAYFGGYKVANMEQLTGTTFQERCAEYLLSCGLTQTQLDKILEINVK